MARRSLTGPIDEAKKEADFLKAFSEVQFVEEIAQELLANIETQFAKEKAFFISVEKQFTECIRTLINNGVDINTINERGDTALYLSVAAGDIPFLNFLIDLGAQEKNFSTGPFDQLIIRGATLVNGNGSPPIGPVDIVIEKDINTSKPIYIDEDSVIAYEEKLDAEWITGGMKKLLTSGDGELFMIKGQGKIWIQSKTKIEYKKD